MFDLQADGSDTFVGAGPEYPWGGLYGGQIVAQSLRAAAATIDTDRPPHSLRAYFIQRGDHRQPVRYEVDRIRDGRSFATRRVVARQTIGAILNFEASFQRREISPIVQPVRAPTVPPPEGLVETSWSPSFARREVPRSAVDENGGTGSGRVIFWFRLNQRLGELTEPVESLAHVCWIAYMSDDLPSDAVHRIHPFTANLTDDEVRGRFFGASLDHTMWFHHPLRADEWHLYDVSCYAFAGARGLAIGHVFAADGTHGVTFAQEVLAREDALQRPDTVTS